jgi:DNA-binding NtrC family response regulator
LLKHIRQDFPDTEVIMITGYPAITGAVECIRLGALDYLVKPFRIEELEAVVAKARDHQAQKNRRMAPEPEADAGLGLGFILGQSPAMRRVFDKIKRAAPSDSTVLLTGESGTGKELVARAIHLLSPRAGQEFVPVDCSALVETLLESELFGHVKGAFTGAQYDRRGLFEEARGGSLFLDDIDDLKPELQGKLLRVLQERSVRRLGSDKQTDIDVRFLAATKADLDGLVRAGAFREDLYYRLNVVNVRLPALSERAQDIPELVAHFIARHGGGRNYTICPATIKRLVEAPWPGNVRELENAVCRAVALTPGDGELPIEDLLRLPAVAGTAPPASAAADVPAGALSEAVAAAERVAIARALTATAGNRTEAARLLGISRKTLWEKIGKLGIED